MGRGMARPPVLAYDWLFTSGNHTAVFDMHIEHSLSDVVRDAVEALPKKDQDIILAKFYERLSYTELAVRIGKNSKGAAWHSVKKALIRLRAELAERGVTFEEVS